MKNLFVIISTVAFIIIFALWMYGLVPDVILTMSAIWILAAIQLKIEFHFSDQIIYHETVDIDFKKSYWVLRMGNHQTTLDNNAIRALIIFIDQNIDKMNPTSDRVEF